MPTWPRSTEVKVDAALTRYGSIQINVFDTDPVMAKDIANDIANLTDSVSNQLRNNRASEAFRYAKQSLLGHQEGHCQNGRKACRTSQRRGLRLPPFRLRVSMTNTPRRLPKDTFLGRASILGKMERLSPFANEFNKITTKLEGRV